MLEQTIIKHKDLEVKVTDYANEGIIDILTHAVQGSEGGMRFQLQNIPERIAAYGNQIRFVSLYMKNKITGTVGSIFRVTGQGKLRYPSSYIRYLAFHSVYQADISMRRRKQEVIKTEKDDTFKQKTLEIFSKPHLLDFEEVKENDKHVMYAFIESMNERSKNLVTQAGYEYIRSFLTVAFSRFAPKPDDRVIRVTSNEDRKKVEDLLLEYYKEHAFFTTDHIFHGDRYYVIKEDGKIVAGVCAIPSSYKIYDMPGIWGWIYMKILPRAPYFKRLFHPEAFHHLILDGIFCQEGREMLLADLFESVCATEGFHTGLTWLDDRSRLFDKLRSGVKMGALNRMLNAKPGLVYARFINFTDEEKEFFYDAPAYVSGFDFS